MRSVRLVIGILSCVLFIVIIFQSCAVGVVNGLEENTTDTSGSAGIILAFFMLIAGITAIVTRDKRTGTIVAGAIYAVGGLIGLLNTGTFSDLIVWSVLCIIFAVLFIVSGLQMPKRLIRQQTYRPAQRPAQRRPQQTTRRPADRDRRLDQSSRPVRRK